MNPFKGRSNFEDYLVIGCGLAILLLIVVALGIAITQWSWHHFMGSVFGFRDLTNTEAFALELLGCCIGRPTLRYEKKS